MTTTRTKHAGGTTVEVFDLTPFGFMGFNTNPLRQVFGDPWHLYGYALESAPVASSVAFTGTEMVGQVLTGTYTYSDADGDLEGTTTFQWYRSNDGAGTGKAAIAGATSSTYTLVAADETKYITFGVTPVALTGTTTGIEVQSVYSGAIADGNFVTTWSATSGAKLTVPHAGTGYSFDIDWGDGETQTGLTEADAPFIKPTNYATTETVTITISGTFPRLHFNNGGDRTKILTVGNWGSVGTTSAENAFRGCTNLSTVANNAWSASTWIGGLRGCTSLNNLPTSLFALNTSCSNFSYVFQGCSSLDDVPADTWANCSTATNFEQAIKDTAVSVIRAEWFEDTSSANRFVNFAQNLTGYTVIPDALFANVADDGNYQGCFRGNPNLITIGDNLFGTTAQKQLDYMFEGAGGTISVTGGGNWVITAVTTMNFMFSGKTINTTDYNAMLVGWEAQTEPTSISFHGGSSKHSGAGTTARGVLTGTSSWTIVDGGAV